MSLATRMQERAKNQKIKEAQTIKLYRDDKNFRADQLIDAWSQVPEIGSGLKGMPLTEARNVAIMLDRQTNFMQSLKESQLATALNDFTPENMLRLVRLSMPNIIRNKVFTEFALETTKDSIKYVKPVFSKTANGKVLNDKANGDGNDPFDYDKDGSNNAEDYRKALYEETRDRYAHELANGIVTEVNKAEGEYKVAFTKTVDNDLSGKWGEDGSLYVDGYVTIYYGKKNATNREADRFEQNVIAIQDRESKGFFAAKGFSIVQTGFDKGVFSFTIKGTEDDTTAILADKDNAVFAFGRYNSEGDFAGDWLGEVEIRMAEYMFKPSATAIGVTWSQLSELTLDTSFNVAADEFLVTAAAQHIRAALDFRAIKYAYNVAKTNSAKNPNYYYEFDAGGLGYNNKDQTTKEGYIHNAQTFVSAIGTIGDVMYDEINRGGVSRLVGGPSACTYAQLCTLYNSKNKQVANGAHQFGEIDGIPMFKVPSSVIPTDEFLCVWKNDECENDVSIAFGTLVPFFSTGVIQRKNFYKEAGIASWGDYAVLNKRYLAVIKIKNIKDINRIN